MSGAIRVALALALGLLLYAFIRWWDFALPSPGAARYQAVFLSNGQTYFGRVVERIGPYLKIEQAYYLQPALAPDAPASEAPRLVRRGDELHRPFAAMLVPRTAIQFIEDLAADSPIGRAMAEGNGR